MYKRQIQVLHNDFIILEVLRYAFLITSKKSIILSIPRRKRSVCMVLLLLPNTNWNHNIWSTSIHHCEGSTAEDRHCIQSVRIHPGIGNWPACHKLDRPCTTLCHIGHRHRTLCRMEFSNPCSPINHNHPRTFRESI